MPSASRSRFHRSTGSGNVRDLNTQGSSDIVTTIGAFSGAAGASTIRWLPVATSSTNRTLPSVGTAQANEGWRDSAAQSDKEISVDAGNWTVSVRIDKTGQTVVVAITVRITSIFYRVNSAGTFQQEIGRVTHADQLLSTVALTSSATASLAAITLAADDKVHVEHYVQHITAGIPAPPAAAVNVRFVLDNSGASASSLVVPQWRYVNRPIVAGGGAISGAGQKGGLRAVSVAGGGAITCSGRKGAFRSVALAGGGVVSLTFTFVHGIEGIIRTGAGTPIAGATVKLFRQATDVLVDDTISEASGRYHFLAADEDHYVVGFGAGIQGVSTPDLRPA